MNRCTVFAALALGMLAQSAAGQSRQGGWAIGLSGVKSSFAGASRDTMAIPGVSTEVRPEPRLGLQAELSWSGAAWEASLGLGFASGHLKADNSVLALEDKSTTCRRFRVSGSVGRRLAALGQNSLLLEAGPTVDRWSMTSFEGRFSFGAQMRLRFRVPLGRLDLENFAALGWSTSPFSPGDLPAGAQRLALRSLSVGSGLRYRL